MFLNFDLSVTKCYVCDLGNSLSSVVYSELSSFQESVVVFCFPPVCMREHWNSKIFAKKDLRKF